MPAPDFNRWHRHFGGPPASPAAPGSLPLPARQEARRAEVPPLVLPMEKFLPPEPRPVNPRPEQAPPLFRWLALAGAGTGFMIAWALMTFR